MDLSVLIPARNEAWLGKTIESVLAAAEAETEIIVVLDGAWPIDPLPVHERVNVIYLPTSVGQRAACNIAARVSRARYLMKLDAHCDVGKGFDRILIASAQELGEDVTQIPTQINLHVFDWLCRSCGHRTYQGPTPTACARCQSADVHREVIWQPRWNRKTTTWRFDSDLKFQYWGEYAHRPEATAAGDYPETMSCLGACWFTSRERYWKLHGLDEGHGSWGQVGTELGCKSWLSGGRMVTNLRTWFAHMFRTQGGDFGFPYPLSGREVDRARAYSRALWIGNTWSGQVRPLSWLIDHFAPVPDWHDPAGADRLREVQDAGAAFERRERRAQNRGGAQKSGAARTKGCVYYSDNRLDPVLALACRRQLLRATDEMPIVAVTLGELPADDPFRGDPRVTCLTLDEPRGILTMFKQQLLGLETIGTDVVFFTEHDVAYPAEHFAFTPPRDDTFYFDQFVYKVDTITGRALHYRTSQTSGCCAARDLLVTHYRERVARVEAEGRYRVTMGFEPGTRKRKHGGIDDRPSATWMSSRPLVDLRHGTNLTKSRWRQDEFRNKRYCEGWTEADAVPGWGVTAGRFEAWLSEVT